MGHTLVVFFCIIEAPGEQDSIFSENIMVIMMELTFYYFFIYISQLWLVLKETKGPQAWLKSQLVRVRYLKLSFFLCSTLLGSMIVTIQIIRKLKHDYK